MVLAVASSCSPDQGMCAMRVNSEAGSSRDALSQSDEQLRQLRQQLAAGAEARADSDAKAANLARQLETARLVTAEVEAAAAARESGAAEAAAARLVVRRLELAAVEAAQRLSETEQRADVAQRTAVRVAEEGAAAAGRQQLEEERALWKSKVRLLALAAAVSGNRSQMAVAKFWQRTRYWCVYSVRCMQCIRSPARLAARSGRGAPCQLQATARGATAGAHGRVLPARGPTGSRSRGGGCHGDGDGGSGGTAGG